MKKDTKEDIVNKITDIIGVTDWKRKKSLYNSNMDILSDILKYLETTNK